MYGGMGRAAQRGADAGWGGRGASDGASDSGQLCEAVLCRLAGSGAIRPDDLDAALGLLEELGADPVRWGAALIRSGRVAPTQWVAALSGVTGESPAEESRTAESPLLIEMSDPDHVPCAVALGCTLEWCRAVAAVPVRCAGNEVWVLTAEPRRAQRARAVRGLRPEARIHWLLTDPVRVDAMIAELARADAQIAAIAATWTSVDTVEVREVVDLLIAQAARDGASDVHIEPGRDHSRVRVRIDGRLLDRMTLPAIAHGALVSRIKVLAQMDIVERRLPQDGTFAMDVDDRHLDVRVASLPTVRGEKLVLRLLPGEMAVAPLEDLGMDPVTLTRYRAAVAAQDGVILCAGPTGAGKTTTLIASVAMVNDGLRHIVTIEDPVEYLLAGVTQVQTNERVGLGFANGLRALLRQDPDVLLVGEIRDLETAAIVVQAALTGHLVFSSIHGTDAVTGLYRLIDMGVAPYLLASAVRAVVAQRLVRLICPRCAQPRPADAAERAAGALGGRVWSAAGCAECRGTGARGRMAVYEVLVMGSQVCADILDGRPAPEVRARAIAAGMGTMVQAALAMVREGRCSPEEVCRVFPEALAHPPGPASPTAPDRGDVVWGHGR